jgi:antitoxin component of RelBE/YafQ-DinJ toxin-antitoxin module
MVIGDGECAYVLILWYDTYRMSKLTLSVDDTVISQAKRYAKKQGVSISKMVEAYLAAVAGPTTRVPADTPILRSLRGILKHADVKDYKRYLATKHR